jgi:hypothetical protein
MSKKRKTPKAKPRQPRPDFSTDPDYWQALGQFVEAFTRAENELFLYLIFITKVNKMVGKALFERDRCATLLATVERVWHVEPPPRAKRRELNRAIKQLRAIQDERNFIVHKISFVYEDVGRVATNRLRAHTERHVVEPAVSPSHLNKMTSDLVRITDHFLSSWFHPDEPLAKRKNFYRALRNAWQYKPRPNVLRPAQQHGLPSHR